MSQQKPKILLCTLNSSFTHAAFGLRYLFANLGALQDHAQIQEFTVNQDLQRIAEIILAKEPTIVGFGVYIWNTDETKKVVSFLRKLDPNLVIVLGGPEISYETESQELYRLANFVIPGEADFSFRSLCEKIIAGESATLPKIYREALPKIDEILYPYNLYTEEDIQNRVLYVEASRGCPYKCEYCLSSLDLSVRNFPIDQFLAQMQSLLDRGARTFKFVDRTFNLSPQISKSILKFFLDQVHLGLFLHFEMVPDRLPDELKELIEKFPAGSLQFEVGIQTWNPEVAALVSRRQNYQKIVENLTYLRTHTKVHTHADLIVGLPGESIESFGRGLDALAALAPDEVQVGILKRLKGTPIQRHDQEWEMVYADSTPFQILKTKLISFGEMQKMQRFARFWGMVANSGNFPGFMKMLQEKSQGKIFHTFARLAQFLEHRHPDAFGISLANLTESVYRFGIEELRLPQESFAATMIGDYCDGGKRKIPEFLRGEIPFEPQNNSRYRDASKTQSAATPDRQMRHLRKHPGTLDEKSLAK